MINKIMKFKFSLLTLLCALLFVGCTKSAEEFSASGYGYVQFKLYKESDSRAVEELDKLNDAKKVRVTLSSGASSITQTLILNAHDPAAAEYGLRSDKLELLVGDYQVDNFIIYDSADNELYTSFGSAEKVSVTQGGLSPVSLFLKAKQYGNVRFSFSKLFVGDDETRSAEIDPYLFSNVDIVSLVLRDKYNAKFEIENIEVAYTIDYSRDESGAVVQQATLASDEYFNIPTGEWRVDSYTLKTSHKAWLADSPSADIIDCSFEVTEAFKQSVDVPLIVSVDDAKTKDYKALKAIWEALDGENWYYQGVNYQKGTNWDFNKDIDMWGQQPGVAMNSHGRVVSLNVSEFGARGDVPAELGDLTELIELYFGTHNDVNVGGFNYDKEDIAEMSISQNLRMAYVEAGVKIPGGAPAPADYAMYGAAKPKSKSPIMRADVGGGQITSDVRSLPKEIGKLQKLQSLYIANTTITSLPVELGDLVDLTDLELYNLPYLKEVPEVFGKFQSLISLNISENHQWEGDEILRVLELLSQSPAAKKVQLLYCFNNNLEVLPSFLEDMSSLALMHFASNKIAVVESMPTLRPVQLFLGDNLITHIPDDFCDTDDLESLSLDFNQIEVFPNLFNSKQIIIESLSISNNKIKSFPSDFKGMVVETLNMSNNLLEEYPVEIAKSNSYVQSINMSYNNIKSFPEGCFEYDNSHAISSIDLQFNQISELPVDFIGHNLPYLYGVDLSFNRFDHFPYNVLHSPMLTVFIFRGQRDADGNRIMKQWPENVGIHTALRALFLGSNDLRNVADTLSYLISTLDISDNPNISIDASNICPYIEMGYFLLYYDKTQDIRNCSALGLTK